MTFSRSSNLPRISALRCRTEHEHVYDGACAPSHKQRGTQNTTTPTLPKADVNALQFAQIVAEFTQKMVKVLHLPPNSASRSNESMQVLQKIVLSSASDTVRSSCANSTPAAKVIRGLNKLSRASTRREYQSHTQATHTPAETQIKLFCPHKIPPRNRKQEPRTIQPVPIIRTRATRRLLHLPAIHPGENPRNKNEFVLSSRGLFRLIKTTVDSLRRC